MRIYVAYHKQAPIIATTKYLVPLHVGAAVSQLIPNMIRDDTGDNISERNFIYSELTGLYWVWKNTTDKVVGLCHYRRYFSPIVIDEQNNEYPLTFEDVSALLARDADGASVDIGLCSADALTPGLYKLPTSLERSHLERTPTPLNSQIFVLYNALYNILGDEYYCIRDYISRGDTFITGNLIVMKREALDHYCTWLFRILFEMERILKNYPRDESKRACAYMAEILYTWFLHSRGIATVKRDVLFITNVYHSPT